MPTAAEIQKYFLSRFVNSKEDDEERDALYGKTRNLGPTEQENLRRRTAAQMQPMYGGAEIINPYASANQSAQAPPQAPQSPQGTPGGQEQFVGGGGYGLYDRATRHRSPEDENSERITKYLDNLKYQGVTYGKFKNLTRDEYSREMAFREGQTREWEDVRGELNRNYERMDQPAQGQVDALNKRAEAIHGAFSTGKINSLEYHRAIGVLKNQADGYRWDSHFVQPGSKPGDIIEEDGIVKNRMPDGELKLIEYTSQYRDQHTRELKDADGNGLGIYEIPTLPGQKPFYLTPKMMGRDEKLMEERVKDRQEDISKRFWQLYRIHMSQLAAEEPKHTELVQMVKTAAKTSAMVRQMARQSLAKEEGRGEIEDPDIESLIHEMKLSNEAEIETERQRTASTAGAELEQSRDMERINSLLPPEMREQVITPAAEPKDEKDMQASKMALQKVVGQIRQAKTKSARAQIIADNWNVLPDMAAKFRSRILIPRGQKVDPKKLPDDIIIERWDGKRFYKLGGKLYPLPDEDPNDNAPDVETDIRAGKGLMQ